MGCCKDENPIQISDPLVKGIETLCCDDDYSHLKDPWYQHSSNNFWAENPVPIKIQLVHPDARPPEKAHNGDIAWDIRCVPDEKWHNCILNKESEPCLELMPGQSHTFSTGIKVAVPHNYGFLLRERSGLAVKSNINLGAGVIEGTYRGEWKIHLRNMSHKPHMFKIGDKIAQAVLIPIIPALPEVVDKLPETERGEKGFGSSGR